MRGNWLTEADWLTPSRVRAYLWLLAALNIATLVWLIATSRGGVDRNGFLLGTDFLSFWAASTLLEQGGAVYDLAAHVAAQRELFGGRDGYTAFFYPPPFLLLCKPFASLGYFSALIVWLGTTGAAYWLAVRAWARHVGLAAVPWYIFAAFPPVWLTITHGQTSFLVAALLGAGCWLIAARRGFVGGLLLGIAIIKPQFGVLVPLVLVASREWRAIAGATVGALAVSLLATAAFGPEIWGQWLAVTGPAQRAMAAGIIPFTKMMSPFAALRLLGGGEGAAYAVQGVVTLGVAAALGLRAWRSGFTNQTVASLLAGSLLATPFVLDYDLALLAFPLVWLAAQRSARWDRIILLLAFVIAGFARPVAMALSIPLAPLVLIALFAVVVRGRAEAPSG